MTRHSGISKQYEKFVREFVNAKTSDEIFLKTLSNIAEIFNFSDEFVKKLGGLYPSRKGFSSLTRIEKQLLLLSIRRKVYFAKAESCFNHFSEGASYNVFSFDYDEQNHGTFTFEESYLLAEGEVQSNGIQTAHVDELHKRWEKNHEEHLKFGENIGYEVHDLVYAINDLARLASIEKAIIRLKKFVSESRFKEIKELTDSSEYVFLASKYIRRKQRNLRNILEEILGGKDLHEIRLLASLLGTYNYICRSKLEITTDGVFCNNMTSLNEELFCHSKLNASKVKFDQYGLAIVFCAVEFFRNIDIRKIKRCRNVGIFIFQALSHHQRNLPYIVPVSAAWHTTIGKGSNQGRSGSIKGKNAWRGQRKAITGKRKTMGKRK